MPANHNTLRKQFKDAIKCGTGRAILILKQNSDIDCSKEIINAAIHNLAYDQQSEGSRATYIYEIIKLSAQKEKIIKTVLAQLLRQKEDHHDLHQMCEIARLAAEDGNKAGRNALYKRFQKNLDLSYTYCGEDSILDMDGMDGLFWVADLRGQMLTNNPDDWEDDSTVRFFQEKNPGIKVSKLLKAAAKTNKNIKTYVEAVTKNQRLRSKYTSPTTSAYDKLKRQIEETKYKYVPPILAKKLGENDIVLLADDFLKEKDPQKLEVYLQIFNYVKFPYSFDPILKIANGRYALKSDMHYYAIKALRLFKDEELRKFALIKLKTSKFPEAYICLLAHNYRKGDSKLLSRIIERMKDDERIHQAALNLLNVYDVNPDADCKGVIEKMYERLNCSICRKDLINILMKKSKLSKKMRAEIAFDSYPETRQLLIST